jgi:hypothetical protein
MHATNVKQESEGLARIRDAQWFLSLGRSAIYELMNQGLLVSVKLNGARRIRWESLRKLAQRGTES